MNLLPAKLQRKITTEPNSGCWLWLGYTDAKGYGRIATQYGHNKIHRLAYTLANGTIPLGLEIDHKCRVRCCCNPDHLEAVTTLENARRGERINATHCFRGHSLADAYIAKGRNGRTQRVCRTCTTLRRKK